MVPHWCFIGTVFTQQLWKYVKSLSIFRYKCEINFHIFTYFDIKPMVICSIHFKWKKRTSVFKVELLFLRYRCSKLKRWHIKGKVPLICFYYKTAKFLENLRYAFSGSIVNFNLMQIWSHNIQLSWIKISFKLWSLLE